MLGLVKPLTAITKNKLHTYTSFFLTKYVRNDEVDVGQPVFGILMQDANAASRISEQGIAVFDEIRG